jgi:predicted RNA-binding protein with PIN domain
MKAFLIIVAVAIVIELVFVFRSGTRNSVASELYQEVQKITARYESLRASGLSLFKAAARAF